MKNLIAANWKSNKSLQEVKDFFENLSDRSEQLSVSNTEVLICPSFPFLEVSRQIINDKKLSVLLGAQNISPFSQGAYTGEVAASQVSELLDFVIIGHSERRRYFKEDEELISKKVQQAQEAGLRVILCVQDEQNMVYEGVDTVAYEPIEAIGTGRPDEPDHVAQVLSHIHNQYPSVRLLYGGSVDKNSIHNYTNIPLINGFLVGGASLEAESFLHLIKACDTKNSQ